MYVLISDRVVDIPPLGDGWNILINQRIVGYDNPDIQKSAICMQPVHNIVKSMLMRYNCRIVYLVVNQWKKQKRTANTLSQCRLSKN
ncbi:MAG: hypothetical protein KBH94_05670 [Caldisericia bacterium]|nr:hypothetical protein [Caldisericia bacterium]